jgi:hypothetical protein
LYLLPNAGLRIAVLPEKAAFSQTNQNQRVPASGEHLKHLLSKSTVVVVKVNKIIQAQPQWMKTEFTES